MTIQQTDWRRSYQEQRPKNAGVHSDQNKRHRTKSNRRKDKQALRAGRWDA